MYVDISYITHMSMLEDLGQVIDRQKVCEAKTGEELPDESDGMITVGYGWLSINLFNNL